MPYYRTFTAILSAYRRGRFTASLGHLYIDKLFAVRLDLIDRMPGGVDREAHLDVLCNRFDSAHEAITPDYFAETYPTDNTLHPRFSL